MHELFARAVELLADPSPGMKFDYVGRSAAFRDTFDGWDEAQTEFAARYDASVAEMTRAWGPPRLLSFKVDLERGPDDEQPELVTFLADACGSATVWERDGRAVATSYGQQDRETPFTLIVGVGSLEPVDTSLTGLLQEWVRWLERLGVPSVPEIAWSWPEHVHAWRKNTTVPPAVREWFGWFAGAVGEAAPGWDFVPYSPHTGDLIPLLRGERGVLAARLTGADDPAVVLVAEDGGTTPAHDSITALAGATVAAYVAG